MKTIHKSIDITAPSSRVWTVLFDLATYSIWASEFSPDAEIETDWKQGGKVIFTDGSKCGLIGTITKKKGGELLSITYTGAIIEGREDYESEEAQSMKGGVETYTLTELEGEEGISTRLIIASDMTESYFTEMSFSWDRALLTIKRLAELN